MGLNKDLQKIICIFLMVVFMINLFPISAKADNNFSDVKENHWAYEYINKLKKLNITSGIGENKYGMGQTITRGEFVTFLVKLMGWELVEDIENNFSDNEKDAWYYKYINTGIKYNIVDSSEKIFRPKDNITREEMAVMIINSLGYGELGKKLNSQKSLFVDVKNNIGYINMAKDFGFINGVDEKNYKPNDTAKREEVAAILVRMYDKISSNIDFKNGFYAIKSYNQKEIIKDMDSVSFGWGRFQLKNNELTINNSASDNNEYILPEGYEEIINLSKDKEQILMVAVSVETGIEILKDNKLREKAVELMVDSSKDYDGVVVDIEGLKGKELKENLNLFLKLLREKIGNKKIFVAVHPVGKENQVYFDGYDYRTIGDIADKVILMAHDYNAKKLTETEMEQGIVETPLTPIEDIYYGLKAITDKNTGVKDSSKILLQISFATAQWKTKDGKVINNTPYTPSSEGIINRMNQSAEIKYNKKYENPYLKFFNEEDNTENIIWYEDSRSVEAKINLAELFYIKGLSIWRIGLIPDGSSDKYMDILSNINSY